MSTISVSLPSDGTTADVSDYNTPITTIVNEINGGLNNSNIAAGAAISTSKIADDAGIGTAKLANDAVTLAKAEAGFMKRLGTNTKTSTGTLLTTSYATHATVTATSTGGEVEIFYSALIRNAGSGGGNNADIKVVCDSTDVTPILNILSADLGTPVEGTTVSFVVSSTPSAAEHTWTLQVKANAGSSVYIDQAVMRVTEIAA